MFGYDTNGYYETCLGPDSKYTRSLLVKRVNDVLFYTASFTVELWVENKLITRSPEQKTPIHNDELRAWVRQQILTRTFELRQLYVNVEEEYVRFGGDINDMFFAF